MTIAIPLAALAATQVVPVPVAPDAALTIITGETAVAPGVERIYVIDR